MAEMTLDRRNPVARAAERRLAHDRAYFDDSDLDVRACRSLWRQVLAAQWHIAIASVGYFGGVVSSRDQAVALDWFFTRDAELVATFAGLDADMVRDRMRMLRQRFVDLRAARPRRNISRIPLLEGVHG
jgi:hypothetical protein